MVVPAFLTGMIIVFFIHGRFFVVPVCCAQVGTEAPPFAVNDQDGAEVTLESFRGEKNVVVFFYPKDNTVR